MLVLLLEESKLRPPRSLTPGQMATLLGHTPYTVANSFLIEIYFKTNNISNSNYLFTALCLSYNQGWTVNAVTKVPRYFGRTEVLYRGKHKSTNGSSAIDKTNEFVIYKDVISMNKVQSTAFIQAYWIFKFRS